MFEIFNFIQWRAIYESLPLVAAMLCSMASVYRLAHTQCPRTRWAMAVALLCSVLMMVAQSSWAQTLIVNQGSVGSTLNNFVWTTEDTLSMLLFTFIALKVMK